MVSPGNPMKILVTGGAGFIGANFLNLLVPRHPEHFFVNLDALTYAANPRSLAGLEGRANYAFVRADWSTSRRCARPLPSTSPRW
jgi:dTDP-glucose 4,6-dehydratase